MVVTMTALELGGETFSTPSWQHCENSSTSTRKTWISSRISLMIRSGVDNNEHIRIQRWLQGWETAFSPTCQMTTVVFIAARLRRSRLQGTSMCHEESIRLSPMTSDQED